MHNSLSNVRLHFRWLGLLVVAFVAGGCGMGDESGLAQVAGAVTWKGQPIPSGFITFTPDATQGATGTQGLAWIRDGKFDTTFDDKCRGVVAGPLQVMVSGYDGQNPSEENPWGASLFTPYITTLAVPESTTDLVIDVP